MTRGEEIDKKIIAVLKKSEVPLSTKDIAMKAGVSWHPARFHCLKLQIAGKISGFRSGNTNLWEVKK